VRLHCIRRTKLLERERPPTEGVGLIETDLNMKKTLKKTEIAIDKLQQVCYTDGMIRNNNTKESNEMTFTKYNTNVNHVTTHEMVASKIEKGLTSELEIIGKIGNILRDMGKNNTQVNFLMNVDNDFITDVLGCYDSDNTPPFDNFHPLNATKISPRWADGSKRTI
jgi:hypothetical protein